MKMKKIILPFCLFFVICAFTFVSCKKDDKTIPVITISGASQIDHILNTAYTDLGATATDDIDGNVSANIAVTGSVNTNLTGNYTLTYNVSDAAGNAATPVTRTVRVYNEAEYLAGIYSSTLTMPFPGGLVSNPTRTVTSSTTVNKNILISGFGESTTSNVNLVVNLAADTISIPQQTGSAGYSFGPYYLSFPYDKNTVGTATPIVIHLYAKQTLATNNKGFEEVLSKQ
jgi:hypothetical protein